MGPLPRSHLQWRPSPHPPVGMRPNTSACCSGLLLLLLTSPSLLSLLSFLLKCSPSYLHPSCRTRPSLPFPPAPQHHLGGPGQPPRAPPTRPLVLGSLILTIHTPPTRILIPGKAETVSLMFTASMPSTWLEQALAKCFRHRDAGNRGPPPGPVPIVLYLLR